MNTPELASLFDIKDKVAVVTGASRGIGEQIARFLARLGAKVVLIARDEKRLQGIAEELIRSGAQAMPLACDLLKVDALDHVMERIVQQYGRIDILINNAGMNIPKPAVDVTEEDWDAVLDMNVKSAFFCSQAAGKIMQRQGGGKIINMSSQMAMVGYYDRSAYCSSKGGLAQMTKALAIEWAAYPIHVNCIAPTFIETEMTSQMLAKAEFKEDVLSRIPLGRLAKAEDLFGAVLFLSCSCSDMVTGQTLAVDGGWTVW